MVCAKRGLDRSVADVYSGARHVRLELWGLPFISGLHRDPAMASD